METCQRSLHKCLATVIFEPGDSPWMMVQAQVTIPHQPSIEKLFCSECQSPSLGNKEAYFWQMLYKARLFSSLKDLKNIPRVRVRFQQQLAWEHSICRTNKPFLTVFILSAANSVSHFIRCSQPCNAKTKT